MTYPEWLSPVIFQIGSFGLRWYGVMYIVGIFLARFIAQRLALSNYLKLTFEKVDDFILWLFVGLLFGARAFYLAIYYDGPWTWITPIAVWEGGLAFHGAVLGMCAACFLFSQMQKVTVWNLTDTLALAGSQGIIFGRIGNFINSELYGRVTDHWTGVRFPLWKSDNTIEKFTEPRHPSQLYEAVGEGLLPFIIIWLLKPYIRREGVLGAIWLCLYAIARFLVEFLREKDQQMSYYFGWMTPGQLFCAMMFLIGMAIVVYCRKYGKPILHLNANVTGATAG